MSVPLRPREEAETHLNMILEQLDAALQARVIQNEAEARAAEDVCEAPQAMPTFWVSKWWDYSDKWGFAYQLSDNSFGVLFNDRTWLLLLADGDNLEYIERSGSESYHTLRLFPESLAKKVTLLKHFRNDLVKNCKSLKAGGRVKPKAVDDLVS